MNKNLLYRYFDGKATPQEIHMIRCWAEESEENSQQLQYERRLFNAMLLTSDLQCEPEKVTRRTSHIINKVVKLAAAIALLFLSVGGTYYLMSHKSESSQLAMQTVRVPSGQRVELTLPDSTHVWLNANTSMTYPVSFMKNSREVSIDGEAFFEVKHDDEVPFIVHMRQMDVRVLGTKFNVQSYSGSKHQEVSLIQGKVDVEVTANGHSDHYLLLPDMKLTAENGSVITSKIADYDVYRWKEGLYCFNNKSVKDILKDFEKYFDMRIILNNSKVGEVILSGKFRFADGLNYALDIMRTEVGFTYYRNDENNTVYIK